MKIFRGFGVVLLLVIAHGLCAYAQARSSSPADYSAAEEKHKDLIDGRPDSMQNLPTRPDGTKGYTTGLAVSEPGFGRSDHSFDNSDDANLHGVFCSGTDAVVVGSLVSSESKLSSGGKTIFTRYEFSVVTILNQASTVVLPKTIYVVNLGGTVVDNGTTFKVKVMGSISYAAGSKYLLILRHAASSPADVFSVPEGMSILVKGGRLYPSEEAQSLVVSGQSLAALEKRFNRILLQHACR